jgi:hypothetical protein
VPDPAHWQALAIDALIAAAEANDEKTRAKLVSLADTYEKLSERSENPKTKKMNGALIQIRAGVVFDS